MQIPKLLTTNDSAFPNSAKALQEPNGLLAIGGNLSSSQLKAAYQQGIFPWYMAGQPPLWWSPDPRAVIFLSQFKIARSLRKIIKQLNYEITVDQAFAKVVSLCAAPRKKQVDTWITPEMQVAYCELHDLGIAHSIEVWLGNELIGGLYGVDCGRIFTGESMFSLRSNASKIALVSLANILKAKDYLMIDCQINNPFLQQFGTQEIPRQEFLKLLENSFSPLGRF